MAKGERTECAERAGGIFGFLWRVRLIILAAMLLVIGVSWAVAQTQAEQPGTEPVRSSLAVAVAYAAAAASVGMSCLGAGVAVGSVGSAAMGAIAERPEVLGRSIIFVGLAEGIAIYGMVISIIILFKV